MEFIVTFIRLAKAVLARGGSVSFEWPRYCDCWRQPAVRKMVTELGLSFVDIDGCSVGVQDKHGKAIIKPWRFAVSSPHLAQVLQDRRRSRDHEHAKCAGGETA
eukprot:3586333-Heterocapsa_arctica.AAC.1